MLAKNISDEIGALSFQILVLNPPASAAERREQRLHTTESRGNFSDLSTANCEGGFK